MLHISLVKQQKEYQYEEEHTAVSFVSTDKPATAHICQKTAVIEEQQKNNYKKQ